MWPLSYPHINGKGSYMYQLQVEGKIIVSSLHPPLWHKATVVSSSRVRQWTLAAASQLIEGGETCRKLLNLAVPRHVIFYSRVSRFGIHVLTVEYLNIKFCSKWVHSQWHETIKDNSLHITVDLRLSGYNGTGPWPDKWNSRICESSYK